MTKTNCPQSQWTEVFTGVTSSSYVACATIGLHYEIDSVGSREIVT